MVGSLSRLCRYYLLLIPLLITGCTSVARQTPMMESSENIDVSADELRVRVWEFGKRMGQAIEITADQIEFKTLDPQVRRNALVWKLYATGAAQDATMQFDPLVAAMDLWTLTLQMQAFFTTGNGKDAFGDHQYLALELSNRMVAEFEDVARLVSASGEIDSGREVAQEWADQFPIQTLQFSRTSVITEVAKNVGHGSMSPTQTVGAIDHKLGLIMLRLAVLEQYWPRKLRWEMDLLIDDMARGVKPSQLTSLRESLERLNDFLERSPDFVSSERAAVLGAIDQQMQELIVAIDAQRLAVSDEFRVERDFLLEVAREERAQAFREIEAMLLEVVDQSLAESDRVIDHFFWRATQLVAGLLAVIVILGGIVVFLLRRRPVPAGPAA